MTTTELLPLILLGGGAFLLIGAAVHFTGVGSLNNIITGRGTFRV